MKILVVDDQRGARRVLLKILEHLPALELIEAKSLGEAIACVERFSPDLVLLDIRLSNDADVYEGFDLMGRTARTHPSLMYVVVSASSEIDMIRRAMRLGAKDYVLKDELSPELLVPIVEGLRERMELRREVARLQERVDASWGLPAILGSSPVIVQLRTVIARVATADATVLILGETGTGKEMAARALHETSPRREYPFLVVNCSGLSSAQLESLLFGHEPGAFPWAEARRRGLLEIVGPGTVLFDEVGEMPLRFQAKLVRVLEDRRFRSVGGSEEIALEARVLASTHLDLEGRLASGKFRDDLYHRLNVLKIDVPSLAARRQDIVELVRAFASELPRKISFTDDAIGWLSTRTWPGNVRELRNVVERASIVAEDTTVDRVGLEAIVEHRDARTTMAQAVDDLAGRLIELPGGLGSKMHLVERAALARAMDASGGNKSGAARMLGVDRKALERRWQKLGEEPDDDESGGGP